MGTRTNSEGGGESNGVGGLKLPANQDKYRAVHHNQRVQNSLEEKKTEGEGSTTTTSTPVPGCPSSGSDVRNKEEGVYSMV